MNELDKLTERWKREHSRRFNKHLGQYYAQVGKLQAECTHKKTHWIQELNKDGTFKDGLFKRCFICGGTVDMISISEEDIEYLLNCFDASVEMKKVNH
jgi:hypothetical protein